MPDNPPELVLDARAPNGGWQPSPGWKQGPKGKWYRDGPVRPRADALIHVGGSSRETILALERQINGGRTLSEPIDATRR